MHPLSMFVLVMVLSGVGWFTYTHHFAPLEHQGINPSTQYAEEQDEKQIMAAATRDKQNSEINGIKVKFVFHKKIGDYAVVQAIPLNHETDPLQIVLQKSNGNWHVIDSGTSFPELEDKLPEGLLQ